MIFLHEWSGFCYPSNLPTATTYVFHYDYTKADNINIFYYPQWLFYISNVINKYVDPDTTYPFACACRNFNNGRPGKIYNYQQLKSKTYYNDILITKFKSIEPFEMYALPETKDPIFRQLVDDFLLDYYTWQSLNYGELELVQSMTTINLDVYRKSLFNIIAETSVHHTILSEKTFKVFASGQIPIMCGPKGAIDHLRKLGFDVFDDIVDHSYDFIENWQQRIDIMHTSLDKLVELDHKVLLDQTRDRRIKNQQYLRSVNLHNTLLDPIVKQIIR
jgi:hypothetical protein